MKKYFEPERLYLGKVITGVKTLTRESDADLAELLQVHRGNVTSFNSQKRPNTLSATSIDAMLRHYGFVFSNELGLKAAKGEFCPVISMRGEHDKVDSRIEDFVKCLQATEARQLQMLRIGNEAGAFALLWDLNEKTNEGWCAVGLGLGANNSALEQFISFAKPTDPIVMIDPSVYLSWCETSPRKSEVLGACINALRLKRSVDMGENLDRAMSQNEPTSEQMSQTSTSPSEVNPSL
jgi:hypothetical protein